MLPWVALFTWLSQRSGRKKFMRMMAKGEIPPSSSPPVDGILRHVLSLKMMLNTVMILEAEAV